MSLLCFISDMNINDGAGDDGWSSRWFMFLSPHWCHWSGPWHSSDSPCLAPSSESRPVFIQLRTFCQDFFLQVTGTKTRSKGWKPFHVAFYSLVTDGSLNFIWGSQISELAQAGRSRSRGETNKSKNYLSCGQIRHVPGLLRPIMDCAQESRAAFVLMSHRIMSGRSWNGGN